LTFEGKPVKASRLFAGYEHEEQVKRLAHHFNKEVNFFKTVVYDDSVIKKLRRANEMRPMNSNTVMMGKSLFEKRSLEDFETYEDAYHQLMFDITVQQAFSTALALGQTGVKKIFVDGGFGKNDVYMNLLASFFPHLKVYSSSIAQASSLGAALALHHQLTKKPVPSDLLNLKLYAVKSDLAI
jgi:sugar (pentulose or hexulose) kinase